MTESSIPPPPRPARAEGPSQTRGKYTILLLVLVFSFAVNPLLGAAWTGLRAALSYAVTLALLGSSVYAFSYSRRRLIFVLGLVLLPLVMNSAGVFAHSGAVQLGGQILLAIFLLYVVFAILRDILGTREVTSDTICGGISVYLLIGVVWAFAYSTAEYLEPGQFNISADRIEEAADAGSPGSGLDWLRNGERFPDLVYYSFVTITTLGYGDITPVSPIARNLAIIEAILGQLYVAILIAKLVGLSIVRQHREP